MNDVTTRSKAIDLSDWVISGVRLLAGRYQIGELVGRGGMTDVHAGIDSRVGRRVAIKLLRPSLAIDPAFRARFRQEAQAAARVEHPTIVRVFDVGEDIVRDPSGHEIRVSFIVTEYVDGRLLRDIVSDGPMDPTEAVRIVDGILAALEYSHRAGLVHRDVKPGNVIVTSTGRVRVMDFGIARAISDSFATIAQTSLILGTAQYWSPEQARGEGVDARTDLYSAGVVLYELLVGHPPFQGDTAVAIAYRHVSEAPIAPNSLDPNVSHALSGVVMRALVKDRTERYQTAADFRADLEIAIADIESLPRLRNRDAILSDSRLESPPRLEGRSAETAVPTLAMTDTFLQIESVLADLGRRGASSLSKLESSEVHDSVEAAFASPSKDARLSGRRDSVDPVVLRFQLNSNLAYAGRLARRWRLWDFALSAVGLAVGVVASALLTLFWGT